MPKSASASSRTASLPIFLEGRGDSTLQEQIYRSVRQCIVDGRISAHHRVPSTRALAAELGVSRTTALLALEQLRAEGYLVARRGSGMYVMPQSPRDLMTSPSPAPASTSPSAASGRPWFSRRGYLLSRVSSPDRRLSGPARVFRLGTPALDLFPHRLWAQLTREFLRQIKPAQRDYAALAGLQPLREAIAEQVQSRGTRCEASQVQVFAGAQRALDSVFHLLLDPGDEAWIEDPGYPGARGALMSAGARVVHVPVDDEGMRVEAGTFSARLVYVTPSCQFPTGVAMSLARRHRLLQWARDAQAWIVEDDYDCDIRHQSQPLPCLHSLDPDGRVIYVGTFSKSLFPALRLGFVIVPRDLTPGFLAARLATDLNPPLLEQGVLAEFLRRGHYARHLRRMQAAYAERLDTLRRAIDRSGAPLRLRPVRAGMHAVVDVEGADAVEVHGAALAEGIETMPLSAYQSAEGPRINALLLGFGAVPPAMLRAGVSRLARVIEKLRKP